MSRKRPVRGSEPEEAYKDDLEDALMLGKPGTIVEPDVRKALLRYFKDMKMLEGTYLSRSTEARVSAHQRGMAMKITKRQLRQMIKEANTDATFSPGEREEFEELLDDTRARCIQLFAEAFEEADRIGGPFRSPGYKSRLLRMIKMQAEFAHKNS